MFRFMQKMGLGSSIAKATPQGPQKDAEPESELPGEAFSSLLSQMQLLSPAEHNDELPKKVPEQSIKQPPQGRKNPSFQGALSLRRTPQASLASDASAKAWQGSKSKKDQAEPGLKSPASSLDADVFSDPGTSIEGSKVTVPPPPRHQARGLHPSAPIKAPSSPNAPLDLAPIQSSEPATKGTVLPPPVDAVPLPLTATQPNSTARLGARDLAQVPARSTPQHPAADAAHDLAASTSEPVPAKPQVHSPSAPKLPTQSQMPSVIERISSPTNRAANVKSAHPHPQGATPAIDPSLVIHGPGGAKLDNSALLQTPAKNSAFSPTMRSEIAATTPSKATLPPEHPGTEPALKTSILTPSSTPGHKAKHHWTNTHQIPHHRARPRGRKVRALTAGDEKIQIPDSKGHRQMPLAQTQCCEDHQGKDPPPTPELPASQTAPAPVPPAQNNEASIPMSATHRPSVSLLQPPAPPPSAAPSQSSLPTEHLVHTLRQAMDVKTTPHDLRWTDPQFGELALRIERHGDELEISIRSAMAQTHETLKQHHVAIADELTLDPEQLRFEAPESSDQQQSDDRSKPSAFSDQRSKTKARPNNSPAELSKRTNQASALPFTSSGQGLDLIA